ncbi:recombination protein NinB [Cupriavidus sp. UYPR2.512]|uniref:recombination protein NinB n=1 Tax=Cupriavidus sp. UYPR2.512 TaxID=1080187 RepID=UPI00037D1EA6|nr:recombination protein NinB [Cupriavidus sp. UYPR2.512]UIF90886.1 recombination protein NinB [Cupriavidus necator]
MNKQLFRLVHPQARAGAVQAVKAAPEGYVVTVAEPTRSLDQNAKFHAICSDLGKSDVEWAGRRRNAAQWKVLLVSGHAIATKEQAEIVPGLEGEFVNIRESTALMSKKRGASLIEYSLVFCVDKGVPLHAYTKNIL